MLIAQFLTTAVLRYMVEVTSMRVLLLEKELLVVIGNTVATGEIRVCGG